MHRRLQAAAPSPEQQTTSPFFRPLTYQIDPEANNGPTMPTFSIFTVLFITLMCGVHYALATVFDCYTTEVTVGCYFPEHLKYALCKETNLACLPTQLSLSLHPTV